MQGRDVPLRRRTGEFRRRVPKKIPKQFNPGLAERLIDAAVSWRDKAILTLLLRTGQRIGDWSEIAGTHGVLGMTLADFDRVHGMITVRLKGARDEHRVPITDDFWPLFDKYVAHERLTSVTTPAAWLGLRRSAGQPLTYAAFESSLRYTARKIGLKVHAHMFRHTLAQGVLDTTGNLKLAQEILGHAHLSTTADLYMHLDHSAMIDALASVKASFDKEQHTTGVSARALPECYAFPYDAITLEELEKVATQAQPSRGEKDDGGSDGPTGNVISRCRSVDPDHVYDRVEVLKSMFSALALLQYFTDDDRTRLTRACHSFVDALDTCAGTTLQERWTAFGQTVWPKWMKIPNRANSRTCAGAWIAVVTRHVGRQEIGYPACAWWTGFDTFLTAIPLSNSSSCLLGPWTPYAGPAVKSASASP